MLQKIVMNCTKPMMKRKKIKEKTSRIHYFRKLFIQHFQQKSSKRKDALALQNKNQIAKC